MPLAWARYAPCARVVSHQPPWSIAGAEAPNGDNMGSEMDVQKSYAAYDYHPGDRIRLFEAVAKHVDSGPVLYPGSYIDIAPSVFFDEVTYVDMDRRATRFFAEADQVAQLVARQRVAAGRPPLEFQPPFASKRPTTTSPSRSLTDRSGSSFRSMPASSVSDAAATSRQAAGSSPITATATPRWPRSTRPTPWLRS